MKHLFFAVLLATGFCYTAQAQNVAINTTGNAADNSAILDVQSTTKGLLAPRMTATERGNIASPIAGLIVYQTTAPAGFYYHTGSGWVILLNGGATGGAGGDLTGTYPDPTIANLPAISGANLTNLNASNLTTGTVGTARLGSGPANSTTYLRGDGTWNSVSATFPTVINAGTAFTNTAINKTSYTDIQTITVPSTGKYLITAYGTITSAAGDALTLTITQGATTFAGNSSYGESSPLVNVSIVVDLTTTTSIIIKAKVAPWATTSPTTFSGNFSFVKLSN
jgi:hypothetical protein